jgi:hypothetical protein
MSSIPEDNNNNTATPDKPPTTLARGEQGSAFSRSPHHSSIVMRASIQKIANRLSHLEQTPADRDVTDAFLAFAEETDDAITTTIAPDLALTATCQAIGTVALIIEPEREMVFSARHIAAAFAAQSFVAVSILCVSHPPAPVAFWRPLRK